MLEYEHEKKKRKEFISIVSDTLMLEEFKSWERKMVEGRLVRTVCNKFWKSSPLSVFPSYSFNTFKKRVCRTLHNPRIDFSEPVPLPVGVVIFFSSVPCAVKLPPVMGERQQQQK